MMLITPNEMEVAFLIGNFKKSVNIGTIITPPPMPENAAMVPEINPVMLSGIGLGTGCSVLSTFLR